MTTRMPFRADQVGSLLRPPQIKTARDSHARGELNDIDLKAVEDRAIADVVAKQEAMGLKGITDGEFRRAWWHFDFLAGLDGVEMHHGERSIQFHGIQTQPKSLAVEGRVKFSSHPMLEHFKYLRSVVNQTPKMTIPGPSVLHFRVGRAFISKQVYPDLEPFFEDTAEAYRNAVKAFYDAGCRYLQFDDTVWAYLCSEKERQAARARGDDPDPLPEIYARLINDAIKDKPDDMVITTHVCRGNFRSSWISEGGYEPVAEILLAGTNYNGYFLEYDTERAGGFEPLRFLPRGDKRVVVGLVTSKSGALESKDEVKRRLEEAGRYADIDQLCLSPQCGFASTEEGNILTEEEQWNKLRFVVELAREVWDEI